MRIAPHPPHGSVREVLPHTALTLGHCGKPLVRLVVCGTAHLAHRFPGSVSGMCFAVPQSPWSVPFPLPPPLFLVQELCSAASQVLWNCPTAYVRLSPASEVLSSRRIPCFHLPRKDIGSPGSRAWSFRTYWRSPTAQGRSCARHFHACPYCLPYRLTTSAP